ncbi:hypothetical protein VTN02DRAFT_1413 [Thermoascus thermophilus]
MADYNAIFQTNLYYPDQPDLLAAMPAHNPPSQPPEGTTPSTSTSSRVKSDPDSTSPQQQQQQQQQQPPSSGFDLSSSGFFNSPAQDAAPGSGPLGFATNESPFLDFDPDADFDFPAADQLIGDLPEPPATAKPASDTTTSTTAADEAETREKRKSAEGKADVEEKGKKRRESDDKSAAKKPGRKPLTSEPTSVCQQPPGQIRTPFPANLLGRSARPRTAPPSARSASARRSTCAIWRTRSRCSRRPPSRPTTRTACCAPRSSACRSSCASTASVSPGSPAAPASPP